jgi:hypothetical protein
MRIIPFSFCPAVPTSELVAFECSDRILVPRCMESYTPLTIICLTNVLKEEITGCVHGVHDGPTDTIYVPSWMFYRMALSYDIGISVVKAERCTHLQLRPHRADRFTGAVAALNKALLNYKTLTRHTRILIDMNPPEFITVELMHPEQHKTCFIHNCGDMDVSVLSPLGPETSYAYGVLPRETRIPFVGRGHTVGSSDYVRPESQEDLAKRMVTAAQSRTHHCD